MVQVVVGCILLVVDRFRSILARKRSFPGRFLFVSGRFLLVVGRFRSFLARRRSFQVVPRFIKYVESP